MLQDETKPVICPKCARRSFSAIIYLPTGQLFCTNCHAELAMAPLPDPRRPAREDTPTASVLATRVRSGRLRRLLMAFGDDRDLIEWDELAALWFDSKHCIIFEPWDLEETLVRQVRRYNETLRRVGAGFIFGYSREASALVRIALEF